VLDLVEAVMRNPFEGPGKPEPLKYVLAGCWSRRVTQEHRLVYRVTDEAIDFYRLDTTIKWRWRPARAWAGRLTP
jgi:Txe/YoeB family toxin of toxin-antitoxin system